MSHLSSAWLTVEGLSFSKKIIFFFSEDINLKEFHSKYYNQKFLNIENYVLQLGKYLRVAIENKEAASKKNKKSF